jgi:hypothetical protein
VHDRSSVVLAATDSWQAYESRQSNGARSQCATYESALFAKVVRIPAALCLPNSDFRIRVLSWPERESSSRTRHGRHD